MRVFERSFPLPRRAAAAALTAILSLATGVPAPAQAGGAVDPALFGALEYHLLGPSRGGRVTAVAGIPEQPSTFYMGATGGGVWKTTDYGASWNNVSDGYFDSPSIGAITVAPSDPDIVYVGTGSDGLRSNLIAGRGMYRSDDGGESWTRIGLRDVGQIGAVEVHPTNPELVYVAAIGHAFGPNDERGVYRSADGGESWEQVLFVSDSVGAVDLELNPSDPNEIYAAMWRAERKPWTIISGAEVSAGVGMYKSTDGGDNWRRIERGLPDHLIGKIDFAVTPADPDRVYALVETVDEEEGLYRSDDRGESWELVSTQSGLMDRPFYYTNVAADPTDADVVYVMATGFWRSTDGGRSFQRRPTPHGDNHDIWINPRDPRIMIESNDGGANVSLDGGESWSTQLNQPTAELYQVAVDTRFPYYLYAGQQDNSTIAVPSRPVRSVDVPMADWEQVGGCETGPAVPNPADWRIVYSNCKGQFGRYSRITGQEQNYWVGGQYIYGHDPRDLIYRFQRVSPIHVSPHDPSVVYHASQYLHRTTDEGKTWETISPDLTANPPEGQVVSGAPITRDVTGEEFFSTIYAVDESPLEEGVIWVGSNDGLVHVTRDGGASWDDVTPPGLPEFARIQNIDASPHDPGEAYVAAYRILLDDFRPYAFRTTDYGRTWTLLTDGTNGIPADHPTRVVREDPNRDGLLYAGTEYGMFISFDEGARWQPFQLNLPVTPVTDLLVNDRDLVLSTMGRSFWTVPDLSPLYEIDAGTDEAALELMTPGPAYRVRYRSGGGEAGPNYPRPGAAIDYWVGEPPADELVLEILDSEGRPVRSFSSGGAGETEREVQGMRAPGIDRLGTATLEAEPGMHRFVWDLSYPGPRDPDSRRSGRGGPTAVPGRYTVRLSAGDWSETRPLELRIDPRVEEDGVTIADLEAQLALNQQIVELLSRARETAARVEAALEARDGSEELRALHSELVTSDAGSYPQPMLLAQISYLYGMTNGADQRPGDQAYERYEQLRTELDRIVARVDAALGR